MGELFAVADKAYHDLAADSAVADKEMAERALVRFLVVGTDGAFLHPLLDGFCDIRIEIGLKLTALARDNAMAVRCEESERGVRHLDS